MLIRRGRQIVDALGACAAWFNYGHATWRFLLTAVVVQLLVDFAASGRLHRVTLTDGAEVQGHVTTAVTGKPLYEYLGIPYAEPPIGPLRFRAPERKKRWPGIWNATKLPNSCMQTLDLAWPDFTGSTMWNANTPLSEDCLYLNVWVPLATSNADRTGRKLSVMVWVYGGGFWSGTSTLEVYDGKTLATEENVVVVSMNYRVSLFGFLYLGRDEAPGNAGLLDQLEALKWVKDHIASFGGDPESVTLFGESAGAASVSMHVISPLSRDFFKQAIMQSGSATAPWAMEPTEIAIHRSLLLSEGCGCNVTVRDLDPNFNHVLDCLRSLPTDLLLQKEWITFEFCDFPWTPVVDGNFFVESPIESLKRGNFKRSNILLGSNLDESMYFIVYEVPNVFKKELFFTEESFITSDAVWEQAAKKLLPRAFSKNSIVYDAILFEYRDWELPGSARRRQDALDKMLGDFHFTCNVNEFAEYYEQYGGSVFMYYFVHQSSNMHWPKWMGVLHGYEIPFVFGEPLNKNIPYSYDEQELSKRMMRYWANFARTGNPNKYVDGSFELEIWPPYTKNQDYLTLGVSVAHSQLYGHGPRRKHCAFWKKYLPKLMSATKDISQAAKDWKTAFDRWQNEYIVDWKHQFDRYAMLQQYRFEDSRYSCSKRND